MLKSYKAVYEDGRLTWLAERPSVHSARVIVTFVAEIAPISATKPIESEFIQSLQGVMEKRRSAYEELA